MTVAATPWKEDSSPRPIRAAAIARRRVWVAAAGIAVLACAAFGLRLFKLGAWSFWGDELVTFYDGRMILSQPYWHPGPYRPAHEEFIHAAPIGHAILGWWHRFSGQSEFWARLPLAVASAAAVVAAVLLICRFRGGWVAAALALLLMAWPWHLFHAQNHRVYSFAYLFGVVGYLLADAGFAERRGSQIALAGIVLSLAGLTHNVAALMLAILIGWQVWLIVFDRAHWPARSLIWVLPAAAGLVISGVLFLRFTKHYEPGATWHVPPVRCVMSLAFNMGLPVMLLALAGTVWAVWGRRRDLYWSVAAAGGVVLATFLVPFVTVFRADYAFAITAPLHVLAAVTLAEAARRVWTRHRSISLAVLAAPLLLMTPSVASYYLDGDRPDFRAAADWLRPRLQPGDVIWSNQCQNVTHYVRTAQAGPFPKSPVPAADTVLQRGGRVWVVDSFATAGVDPQKLKWLRERFRLQTVVQHTRLDYHQNGVGIYLADGAGVFVAER